jgi:hypothetical protein
MWIPRKEFMTRMWNIRYWDAMAKEKSFAPSGKNRNKILARMPNFQQRCAAALQSLASLTI